LERSETKAQLATVLNEIVPVPDQEHQKRIIKRLVTQDTIPSQILAFVGNQYRRNWVDDRIFHVEQSALLATSFDTLVEDVADYIDPTDEPETLWKVFGVSNEDGIRLGETKLGSEFKQGRAYKRLVKSAIAYNPQRINVGSVGIVAEADERSLISPYYPIFLCKEELDAQFALNLIRSPYFRALIEETAVGAVRNELFFSLFTQIEVPIPILTRQHEILKQMDAEAQRLAQYSIVRRRADEELTAIIADLFERMHATSEAAQVRSAT
jgi:restriction endonuclease S subunit